MPQEVRKLSQFAVRRVAELVVSDKLPPSLQLSTDMSNDIFEEMRRRSLLDEESLKSICRIDQFQLDRIDLTGLEVSVGDLEHFRQQNLVSLRLGNFQCSSNCQDCQELDASEVVHTALNPISYQQLRHLDVSGNGPLNVTWVTESFPSLKSLSIAGRNTTNEIFTLIGSTLSQLRTLNVSSTGITDISPISNLKNLEILVMYNVKISTGNVAMLASLTKLRALDISRNWDEEAISEHDSNSKLAMGIFNESLNAIGSGTATPWPELRTIEMTGLFITTLSVETVRDFVYTVAAAHPNLEQFGLLNSTLPSNVVEVNGRKNSIINSTYRASLNFSLFYYINLDRPRFIRTCLISLDRRLNAQYDEYSPEESEECFSLVSLAMQNYLDNIRIQIAATCCLSKYCETAAQLSLARITTIFDRCLKVLDHFLTLTTRNPQESHFIDDMRHNAWVCILRVMSTNGINNFIKSTNGIYNFRISRAALDTLLVNTNENFERNIIPVLGRLSAGLRKVDYIMVCCTDKYIKHLVPLMDKYLKIDEFQMLEFIVDVVWNLSSEHLAAFPAFVKTGGIQISVQILQKVKSIGIQRKVLALLIDLFEKAERPLQQFFSSRTIAVLLSCVIFNFQETDVNEQFLKVQKSYSAAYLLIELQTYYPHHWECVAQQQEVSEKLLEMVRQLPDLDQPIIEFDAFGSFENIMEHCKSYGAVLLCLWTLYHLMEMELKNNTAHHADSYVRMFLNSKVCEQVLKILHEFATHYRVVMLAQRIAKLLLTILPKDHVLVGMLGFV